MFDINRGIDRLLPWRNLWWWPRWKVPSFVMLHSVGEDAVDPCCPNNTVRPDELRNFIKAMRKDGYAFKTFVDAIEDGDARTVLAAVADFEMKRVCGRNADSIVMVYDKPSFDAMRPTPYFDYRIEAEGATMREYGFRCVYNN
jgi:hypothetical protein